MLSVKHWNGNRIHTLGKVWPYSVHILSSQPSSWPAWGLHGAMGTWQTIGGEYGSGPYCQYMVGV